LVVVFVVLISASLSAVAEAQVQVPADPLPCTPIGSAGPTSGGRSIVAGRVALPTRKALQLNRTETRTQFAKQGLLVKPGASFTLIVPKAWRGRLTISWGGAPRTTRLSVSGCGTRGDKDWLAFAGGFYIDRPACISLIVRAGGSGHRVRIGVGAPCPGQAAPPPGG
jgi:hypothetical protein